MNTFRGTWSVNAPGQAGHGMSGTEHVEAADEKTAEELIKRIVSDELFGNPNRTEAISVTDVMTPDPVGW